MTLPSSTPCPNCDITHPWRDHSDPAIEARDAPHYWFGDGGASTGGNVPEKHRHDYDDDYRCRTCRRMTEAYMARDPDRPCFASHRKGTPCPE